MDERGVLEPWSLDDLEDYAVAHDDPFAGRVLAGARPAVTLQIEATTEPPVWIGLEPREIAIWAGAVSRMWKRFGLRAGDAIAFFDYGSNPCVLLSSSIYVPHLRRGAATRLGASAICNDGVASMTARVLVILETVRPAALLVRRDLIAPLVDALGTRGTRSSGDLRWAAVSEVEGPPSAQEAARLSEALGVPVYRLLRADAAFFVAGDCHECRLFHVDRSYRVETLGAGEIAVTAPFAEVCPAVRYRLGAAEVVRPGCAADPKARRIAWP